MQYNDELKALQEEIRRKKHIKAKLESLREREREILALTGDLRRIMEYENADVERLESTNAVSVFYTLLGRKVEKLDRERKEAIAATEKYKLAEAEYKEVALAIDKCNRELLHIERCEQKYEELWRNSVDTEVSAAAEDNAEVRELRDKMLYIETRINEIEEAISEGKKVLAVSERIIEYISEYLRALAPKRKGGSLADFEKEAEAHRKLMAADNMLTGLQSQITRFRAELSDVDIDFNDEAYPYTLVRASNIYADIWVKFINFDFSERDVREEMKGIYVEVTQILTILDEKRENLKKRRSRLQSDINKIISL